MRIGIVTGEYPPMRGGVGAYSRILARELVRQGHHVFILSSATAGSTDKDIPVETSAQSWGPLSLRTIARWAQEQQLDMLNVQYQIAVYQMSPWIHFLPDVVRRIPVVTTFHDLRHPYLFPKAGRLRDWIVMRLARASDGVIVTNHEDWQRTQHLSNVKLIPIGSNMLAPLLADFDPLSWRAKAGAGADDFLLAFFGLVNRSKGLDVLLQSVSRLRQDSIPARLVVIGDVGTSDSTNATYAAEVEQEIDKLGLRPFVHYTGFLDSDADVGSYLVASDVVALPFLDGASYRRGSLMAAIRYGCPIVSTQPRVPIETFVNGENMLLVEPGNSDSLAASLRQLFHSPELRQRLKVGAIHIAQCFDWSQIAADYTNFLYWIIEEVAGR